MDARIVNSCILRLLLYNNEPMRKEKICHFQVDRLGS